jgi:site-specific DNA recombinase
MVADPESTVTDVAKRIGQYRKRVARLLRIAMLAPDIVARCLEGTQPVTLTTARLFTLDVPLGWTEQRKLLGIA